jgi:hypothetical protein
MSNFVDTEATKSAETLVSHNAVGGSLMQRMQWHLAWERAFFSQQKNNDNQFAEKNNSVSGRNSSQLDSSTLNKKDFIAQERSTKSASLVKVAGIQANTSETQSPEMSRNASSPKVARSIGVPYSTREFLKIIQYHKVAKESNIPGKYETNTSKEEKLKIIRQGNDVRVFIQDEALNSRHGIDIISNLRDTLWRNGLRLVSIKMNRETLWEIAPRENHPLADESNGLQIDRVY